MLRVSNVFCKYDGVDVIQDISFTVGQGEKFCILGPNGCGKTTLLKAMSNLMGYSGSITYQDKEISAMKRKEAAKKIAFMTQTSNVYFPYSVFEIVSFGRYARIKNSFGRLTKEDKDIVLQTIENVGLIDKKDDMISTLSGGEFQRVFLARAFAQDPDVLLLDEPTNHLDMKCQYDFLEQLDNWSSKKDKIVISVLHDLNLAAKFAGRSLLLRNGKQVFLGEMNELLKSQELSQAYEMNVKETMIASLKRWE